MDVNPAAVVEREASVAGEMVGVRVRLEHADEPHVLARRLVEVLLDRVGRVDDHRCPLVSRRRPGTTRSRGRRRRTGGRSRASDATQPGGVIMIRPCGAPPADRRRRRGGARRACGCARRTRISSSIDAGRSRRARAGAGARRRALRRRRSRRAGERGGPQRRRLDPRRQADARTARRSSCRCARSLGDGDYSVRWSAVSDDGHIVQGVLAFGVGTRPARRRCRRSASTNEVGFGTVFSRWIFFAGLLVGSGLALFDLLVWRPLARSDIRTGWIAIGLAAMFVSSHGLVRASHGGVATRFGLAVQIASALAATGRGGGGDRGGRPVGGAVRDRARGPVLAGADRGRPRARPGPLVARGARRHPARDRRGGLGRRPLRARRRRAARGRVAGDRRARGSPLLDAGARGGRRASRSPAPCARSPSCPPSRSSGRPATAARSSRRPRSSRVLLGLGAVSRDDAPRRDAERLRNVVRLELVLAACARRGRGYPDLAPPGSQLRGLRIRPYAEFTCAVFACACWSCRRCSSRRDGAASDPPPLPNPRPVIPEVQVHVGLHRPRRSPATGRCSRL